MEITPESFKAMQNHCNIMRDKLAEKNELVFRLYNDQIKVERRCKTWRALALVSIAICISLFIIKLI